MYKVENYIFSIFDITVYLYISTSSSRVKSGQYAESHKRAIYTDDIKTLARLRDPFIIITDTRLALHLYGQFNNGSIH